eukprot:Gregarina_sp_Poly_1__6728@NODE_361_length_9223_cov_159_738751_g298_i0_p3_GENE_NODE_361_length_9223_cov_159_738751_g298_i0NODE_361_length_9223_cov_159_738751_g298_i0_p3_ORF_typecomplete_len195_score32_84NPV_P10/PF05531_12/0_019Surfac_Dtrimer/PF09006_11/0_025Dioxygenase_N/PF04444_14/2_3Dioxygenase_N/PF04444_14/16SKA2/PF16740_5/0_098Img2/PF05046_14/0_21DUF3573/PF12097_8/0_18DXP_reductoisom/PF02670_16/2DXP_reductoisom/PF02670_16/1_6e02_NODE_361_length_9223_cov_159_738751_g298_i068497433
MMFSNNRSLQLQSRAEMTDLLHNFTMSQAVEGMSLSAAGEKALIAAQLADRIVAVAEKWQNESTVTTGTYFKGVDMLAHKEAKLEFRLTEQMVGLAMLIKALRDDKTIDLVSKELGCDQDNDIKRNFIIRQRIREVQGQVKALQSTLSAVQEKRAEWIAQTEMNTRRRSIVSEDEGQEQLLLSLTEDKDNFCSV